MLQSQYCEQWKIRWQSQVQDSSLLLSRDASKVVFSLGLSFLGGIYFSFYPSHTPFIRRILYRTTLNRIPQSRILSLSPPFHTDTKDVSLLYIYIYIRFCFLFSSSSLPLSPPFLCSSAYFLSGLTFVPSLPLFFDLQNSNLVQRLFNLL